MKADRFNQLLTDTLAGQTDLITSVRVVNALRHVVTETGDAGANAFEQFCAGLEKRKAELERVGRGKEGFEVTR